MPGLPNTRLIPPAWEQHHAPTAEQAMTAECVVTRPASTPGQPTFDELTGRSVYPTSPTVYTGSCRMQRAALSGIAEPVIGGKPTPMRRYQFSTPLAAPPLQVNDVVEVTTAADPEFVGGKLRIVDVHGGSLVWQRNYMTEQWTPTAR